MVIPDERFPGLESDDADSDLSGFDPILPPPELSELPQIPHIPQNLADENADAHRENGLDNGYNPWQTFFTKFNCLELFLEFAFLKLYTPPKFY